MTNRLKHLLAFYAANRGPMAIIAKRNAQACSTYKRICGLHTAQNYTRQLRTAEIALGPDPYSAFLLDHHVKCAAEYLTSFPAPLEDPNVSLQHKCKYIRNLPERLLDRLQAVFSRNDLYDPEGSFQKRFCSWHQSYIDRLDKANAAVRKGKGTYLRLYSGYQKVMLDSNPLIETWFTEMIGLGNLPFNLSENELPTPKKRQEQAIPYLQLV